MDLDLVVDERMQQSVEESKIRLRSRKTYDDKKHIIAKMLLYTKKTKKSVDAKIEASAKEFEKILESTRKRKATISEFNRKLKNPASVREYILFSEILGKPKAMRR